ncbi:hypothetical protein VIN01S_26430 [Vibrio inusitatus NBRC 102082]|uniref:Uncharacterized protein n=1 Tax=Vibrio inusitatus NBRC 102082 TaxID=1219070 RepID=A0A4Y3HXD7_9VIBR|nr:hypothetical protein [Vibrio inusitatus]GEA51839.1 hypothetical protein VIN01S_26430 [Vibrio inusitatus NBRC 102082]
MKKIIITATAITSLFLSTSVFANNELSENAIKHFTKETEAMTAFLDLSQSQSDAILVAKIDLEVANLKLIELYGRGSDRHLQARKPHWQAYQKAMTAVVSKEDQKRYQQSK